MPKLSRLEQEELVVELICGMEAMDMDEWKKKYDMLSPKNQAKVDEASLEFADNAVGSSWRSDW